MPVYNGEKFIDYAISSILSQTFRKFELIIINDASTDNTQNLIHKYVDTRISIIHNDVNMGPSLSRNKGLSKAKGIYIASLDSDDMAYPERLAVEKDYLDAHPEVALVGTACEIIDEEGSLIRVCFPPVDPVVIKWLLLFDNPLVHSSVMYRRDWALQAGGYDPALSLSEDYALWSKLAISHPLAQIPEVLTKYRICQSSLMRRENTALRKCWLSIAAQNIERLTGTAISPEVAGFLSGEECFDRAVIERSYGVFWSCLVAYLSGEVNKRDRRNLLEPILTHLLRLARQNEAQRLRAFEIARRYILFYAPEDLFSRQFIKFAMRMILPKGIRHWFRPSTWRKLTVA
jgi:glycosyltransferase involved in cell wall biosynthesis